MGSNQTTKHNTAATPRLPRIGQLVHDRDTQIGGVVTATFPAVTRGPVTADAMVLYRDCFGQIRQSYVAELEWEDQPTASDFTTPLDAARFHALIAEAAAMYSAACPEDAYQMKLQANGQELPDYFTDFDAEMDDAMQHLEFRAGIIFTEAHRQQVTTPPATPTRTPAAEPAAILRAGIVDLIGNAELSDFDLLDRLKCHIENERDADKLLSRYEALRMKLTKLLTFTLEDVKSEKDVFTQILDQVQALVTTVENTPGQTLIPVETASAVE